MITSQQLQGCLKGQSTLLGIGNTMRGDDGFGPMLVKALAGHTSLRLLDCGVSPENFIFQVSQTKPKTVLFADATDFGGKPGQMGIFGMDQVDGLSFSTHNASLTLLADLLRADCGEEVNLWVLAVQPKSLAFGVPMSDEVRRAVDKLAKMFIDTAPLV